MSVELAIAWTTRLVCVGAAISTLELLWLRRELGGSGLYAWRVLRSRPAVMGSRTVRALLDRVLDEPIFPLLLGIRLVGLGVAAIWPNSPSVAAPALGVVLAITLLCNLRSAFGQDGSDQMSTQILLALFVAACAPRQLAALCLAYICAQALLSYSVAGVAKLFGPLWRGGDAVRLIFNTSTYGVASVARVLDRAPRLSRALTWSVVGAEVLFPLVLVAGLPWLVLGLVWGVTFHALNALIMGLNSFFWSFVASYPAIVFCALWIAAT
ncbi:MAG: hypothetical protein DWQ30_23190 [Acidobacteria bacterium]|nr:MAG: hypothetical protein DWQ30_23190 [Acidobacteriota bacterium]